MPFGCLCGTVVRGVGWDYGAPLRPVEGVREELTLSQALTEGLYVSVEYWSLSVDETPKFIPPALPSKAMCNV